VSLGGVVAPRALDFLGWRRVAVALCL
jgi:hypothetical protein